MLVFCSTKKWCQQTAGLLAKEVISDRNRVAARDSAAAKTAAAKASHSNRGGERTVPSAGFVPAKSVALAAATESPAASSVAREGEGAVSTATEKQHDTGAAMTTAEKDRDPGEGRRTASASASASAEPPSAADAVREKLRQTPVGLDAELSYLVRRVLACRRNVFLVFSDLISRFVVKMGEGASRGRHAHVSP